MDLAVFALYVAAPMLALAGIVFVFGLRRSTGQPFLSDYLAFLTLSGLWGFVLWTFPGLLRLLAAETASPRGLSAVISTTKWVGFPFHLLQLYFLILTLAGILGRAVSRGFKRVYFSVSALLVLALFAVLGLHLRGTNRFLFPEMHRWVTDFYLAFQAAVYVWGLVRAAKLADRTLKKTAGAFSGLYLAAFGAYYFLSNFDIVSRAGAGILFSAVHLPALVFLFFDLRRRSFAPPGPVPQGASLDEFCARFGLSPREKDIVRRLLEGQPNRQMEKELFLSLQTIKNYVSRIYKKIGVRNRLELMGLFRKLSA